MEFVNEDKHFASTEGSHIEQSLIRSNPSFSVTAVDKASGKFDSRASLTRRWAWATSTSRATAGSPRRATAAEEAVAKHRAKTVSPACKHLILQPTNLWLTIHESVGHPTELDRALGLGGELRRHQLPHPRQAGQVRVRREIVNFVADKTQAGGWRPAATTTTGSRRALAPGEGRMFVDYQTTREQAHADRPEGLARVQLRRQLGRRAVPAHAQRLAPAGREGGQRGRPHLGRPTTAS